MIISHDIFDLTTTDITFYDNILKGKRTTETDIPITFEIVEMSPDEYLNKCCKMPNCTLEEMNRAISENNLKDLDKWSKKNKFPLPFLNFAIEEQEGRHRAVLTKRRGYLAMPVLVIKPL